MSTTRKSPDSPISDDNGPASKKRKMEKHSIFEENSDDSDQSLQKEERGAFNEFSWFFDEEPPPMEKKDAENHVDTPFLKTDSTDVGETNAPLSFWYESDFSDADTQQSSDSDHIDLTASSSTPSSWTPLFSYQLNPSAPLLPTSSSSAIPNDQLQWPLLEMPVAQKPNPISQPPLPKSKKVTTNTHENPAVAISRILNLPKTEIPTGSSMPQVLRSFLRTVDVKKLISSYLENGFMWMHTLITNFPDEALQLVIARLKYAVNNNQATVAEMLQFMNSKNHKKFTLREFITKKRSEDTSSLVKKKCKRIETFISFLEKKQESELSRASRDAVSAIVLKSAGSSSLFNGKETQKEVPHHKSPLTGKKRAYGK